MFGWAIVVFNVCLALFNLYVAKRNYMARKIWMRMKYGPEWESGLK